MELFLTAIYSLGGFATIFALAFGACFWWLGDLWERSPEREDWALWLQHNAGRHRYRRAVEGGLARFSGFLGRREIQVREVSEDDQDTRNLILTRNQHSWSWGLLDFALLLALGYPVTSLIIQWLFTGEGRLGTLPVIPDGIERGDRFLFAVCIAVAILFFQLSGNSKTRWGWIPFTLASGLLICAGAIALNNNFAIAFTVVFAFVYSLATGFAGAFAVAFACSGAGSVAFAGALTVTDKVTLAGLFTIAIAFAGDWLRRVAERRVARPVRALMVWILVLYFALITTSVFQHATEEWPPQQIAALLLFMGFLPLINAFADFLSTGLTRKLLAKGARGRTPAWAVADIVLGCATFLLLGAMMIGTLALLAWLGAPPLLDLDHLLALPGTDTVGRSVSAPEGSILGSPGDYWWLYLTFLSTLFPTMMHGAVATFSIFAIWPQGLRDKIADGLRSGRSDSGRLACVTLVGLMAGSFTALLAVLFFTGLVLFWNFPGIGEGLVGMFRDLAQTLGVIA